MNRHTVSNDHRQISELMISVYAVSFQEQRKISRIGWVICCFSIVILLHYYYVKEPPAKPMRILYPDQFKLVEMNSRTPVFKLATSDGKQPYADGDRAQGTVVESLQLADRCRRDPSLIVVDVGAFLGMVALFNGL